MPRDLADVLHHLLPEANPPGAGTNADLPRERPAPQPAAADPAALSILAVPVGDQDALRAAFVWNLAVETLRAGSHATVVAPARDRDGALWPDEEARPLGAEIVWAPASDLTGLARVAHSVAARRPGAEPGGIVFVRVPPSWMLAPSASAAALLRWTLLLCSADPRELLETYGLSKLLLRHCPGARIGVTIHGTHRRGEAREAFSRLADVAARRLGIAPHSYGLVTDDVQVYRAVLAQRPIGHVHPQGAAARSLGDVAGLLLEDLQASSHA